jgi:predicted ATPase
MALLGKQCVIETHSEYLINRLRLRIASSEINIPLSPMIKIYFVEKEGDSSTFREVIVNEYGAIPEWPDGFFDQSQDEAEHILRAATAKRRVLRPNSEDAKRNN